jgi:autotransporter-associated beta strand protein
MGDLNVNDIGTISYDPAANDRVSALGSPSRISNVNITSTGGLLSEAQFFFDTNRDRSMVVVGDLSLLGTNAGVQIQVRTSSQASGNSSGISFNSIIGTSDTRLVKWGIGMMYVRAASPGFSGTVSIEQGAIQINNINSFGSASSITVRRTGVLDINTGGTAYTGAPVYLAGSIERWTSDNARSGSVNLGGASLQVGNDQTTTSATITINGGSIQGYLRNDDNLTGGQGQAVYRTIGSGVNFVLAGNSFLGQDIFQGTNGLDNGRAPVVFTPTSNTLVGSSLEIKGAIGGGFSLTKQGYDVVTLSGANTYSGGTRVNTGLLRIGANNALPNTGNLITTGGGMFDLNGYNQIVGQLTSPATGLTPATTNASGSGYITNTATTINTLTVGNSTTTDFVYGGVIQYNVAIAKTGNNNFTVTNANTYNGGTNVNSGTFTVQNTTGSGTGFGNVTVNSSGILRGTGTIAPDGGNSVTIANGGTLNPGNATTNGTLNVNSGIALQSGSIWNTKITATGASAAYSTGGSTTGTLPISTNHNFLNLSLNGGTATIDSGTMITIDVTATDFSGASGLDPYSYQIASGAGNQATLNITNQSQFSMLGWSATNYSLTGDASGAVYLNFTPVPEPVSVLACSMMGLGLVAIRRRIRKRRSL